MKIKILAPVVILAILFACMPGMAQSSKTNTGSVKQKKYPASFVITKADLDQLLLQKPNTAVSNKTNGYLDKAILLTSTESGDMKFLKLKLDYFKNASLQIQVNGVYSTQIFILSDDNSVFYKGRPEKDGFIMSKCSKDDIVSE